MWCFIETAPKFIRDKMTTQDIPTHSIIMLQGIEEKFIYIVVEGVVSVFKLNEDGKQDRITISEGIDILGDVEVLVGKETSINMVRAETPCKVVKISYKLFDEWLKTDNAFCYEVLRLMAEKQYSADYREMMQKNLNVYERLAVFLYIKSDTTSSFSKEYLTHSISCESGTLNKALRVFATKGYISIAGKNISIGDRQGIYGYILAKQLEKYII